MLPMPTHIHSSIHVQLLSYNRKQLLLYMSLLNNHLYLRQPCWVHFLFTFTYSIQLGNLFVVMLFLTFILHFKHRIQLFCVYNYYRFKKLIENTFLMRKVQHKYLTLIQQYSLDLNYSMSQFIEPSLSILRPHLVNISYTYC